MRKYFRSLACLPLATRWCLAVGLVAVLGLSPFLSAVSAEEPVPESNTDESGASANVPATSGETVLVHGIPGLQKQLDAARGKTEPTTIKIPVGTYHFYYERGIKRELYISNHDQPNPRSVGISLEGLKNVTIDGSDSKLIFHGKMLPVMMKDCENCTLRNFSIDFDNPSICQLKVLRNDPDGITVEIAPEHHFEIVEGQVFFYGDGWRHASHYGTAFDGATRHLLYNTSDPGVDLSGVIPLRPRVLKCPNWHDDRLVPGTIFATRGSECASPGIFLYLDKNTKLENIQIHYAEGKCLLAQLCENIDLNGVSVCQKGPNDPRYFTAQADALHFSGCKGLIRVENGLYEAMMDDAINVHGTYLKVVKRVDDQTLEGRYMHSQTWGFHWGDPGDKVQFVNSSTMEVLGEENQIESIVPADQPTEDNAKVFRIRFSKPVPAEISEAGSFGIENLTWTPEVIFRKNVVRNNRARGALFSTPKRTLVEENLFDHTSGCAILLCGDCNGWYETGACREVVIRKNRFINALTCQFQFTNAVISIYPEIPNLAAQQKYFHGGTPGAILVEDNTFETFDQPLVYAKSLDGLTFRGNTVKTNHDFPAFHWNTHRFFFQRAINVKITDDNQFEGGFEPMRDVLSE